jgi:hypothetical protein
MVYACDNVNDAVREMAYYDALVAQQNLGRGHIVPPTTRFIRKLWEFEITKSLSVGELASLTGGATFPNHWPVILMNPGRYYAATQDLATQVISHSAYRDGTIAPAVRCRLYGVASNEECFVFVVRTSKLPAKKVGSWIYQIAFVDDATKTVSIQSTRVCWHRPTVTFPRSAPSGWQVGHPISLDVNLV